MSKICTKCGGELRLSKEGERRGIKRCPICQLKGFIKLIEEDKVGVKDVVEDFRAYMTMEAKHDE